MYFSDLNFNGFKKLKAFFSYKEGQRKADVAPLLSASKGLSIIIDKSAMVGRRLPCGDRSSGLKRTQDP